MNLILLLSALLSALTGVSPSARTAERPTISRSVAVVATASTAAVAARAQVLPGLPALADVAGDDAAVGEIRIADAASLLTNRRRE